MTPKIAFIMLFLLVMLATGLCKAAHECGGTFTAVRGVLSTPNFPGPFQVPIHCRWIIDASLSTSSNTTIAVYLTQLFVFGGLTFTDYHMYERGYTVKGKVLHTVNETNIVQAQWVKTDLSYLVIELDLETSDSEHLRVLDNFLDVYGFNITYEITNGPVRPNSCTMKTCGFTGVCYDHFNKFSCDCFEGYSGPHCSSGPKSLCYNAKGVPTCKNNATCVHCGTSAIICHCKRGFTGRTCETPVQMITTKRGCDNCQTQCSNEKLDSNKSNDLIGYSATMHLSNLPTLGDSKLKNYIKNQLLKGLKQNFTRVDNVTLDSVNHFMSGVDVAFHFYWLKREEKKVKVVLSKWVEKGYIGNITILDKELQIKTVLSIQSFTVNQVGILREGDEFILSCVAKGSPSMIFRWFKDGLLINVTTESHKWTRLIKDPHVTDQYTALLAIQSAKYLDDGVFTCQVEDYGIQQCLSKKIQIGKPPKVNIEPMSITVEKGENFTIKCITKEDTNGRTYNYFWTKNKNLLPVKTDTERYEVLYPSGTILQIFNAEKYVQYSCKVQDGSTSSSEMVVDVNVVDKLSVRTCPKHIYLELKWPETAPDTTSIQLCPEGYTGVAYRSCLLRDGKKPAWALPDFSQCTHNQLAVFYKKMELLKLGYISMPTEELFEKILQFLLRSNRTLLPGEGARNLYIVDDILNFLDTSHIPMNGVNESIISVIDNVLTNRNSLINQTYVQMVPQVITKYLSIFTAGLMGNESAVQYKYHTMDLTMLNLTMINENNFYIPPLGISYSDLHGITVDGRFRLQKNTKNNILSMTLYKNISTFLPPRSYLRIKDGSEIKYEILSEILSFTFNNEGNSIIQSLRINFPRRIYNHSQVDAWSVKCASADLTSFTDQWDIYNCSTVTLEDGTVQCVCPFARTVALLLTTTPVKVSADVDDDPRRYILIGSCSLCMALALFTTACLATSCWMQKSTCLIFLKLQCSLSVFCTALLFTLATVSRPAEFYFVYFLTSLETFILLALSSHLSKLLIVFTELVHLPRPVTSKETVIGIISGVPIITVFGSHLAYRTMDIKMKSWWMIANSFSFNLYVTVTAIITLLFIFVYVTVMTKLQHLVHQHVKHARPIKKRVALLRRCACLFAAISMLSISSIIYINLPNDIWSFYQFGAANVVLGIVLIVCYVIKGENEFHTLFQNKNKLTKDDKFFSVDSTSSPLNYVRH
ncbi:unnamed protein product [Brassicogethes aeneus]|uniref:Uncharacterized protein n=1 Tax=Brassicogethes aeneus TaxID=1431903 RepID=A0A9P0B6C1_BRAAE|nr:unnamed protein product [Brassicogethes aeneus]